MRGEVIQYRPRAFSTDRTLIGADDWKVDEGRRKSSLEKQSDSLRTDERIGVRGSLQIKSFLKNQTRRGKSITKFYWQKFYHIYRNFLFSYNSTVRQSKHGILFRCTVAHTPLTVTIARGELLIHP